MLHTHDDFLSAIAAQPSDRTLRLVYADWLDEQDDVRGALVRVEEEMRELPVFSDRFWELKPRRNALREQVGPEWCGRMRYGTECEPVFRHGIPDGWRERWRLIREFTERWHRIPMGDVGGRQKEIAEAEERLVSGSYVGSLAQFRKSEAGRKLPPSVREWVAFVSDLRSHPNCELSLLTVNEPGGVPGQAATSLWWMRDTTDGRMGDSHSGVRFADFTQIDPPVYIYWETLNADYEYQFSPSDTASAAVSAFALDHVLSYTRGAGGGFVVLVNQPGGLSRDLSRAFSLRVKFGDAEWYEADDIFVRFNPWPGDSSKGFFLSVSVAKPIPREQIPNFLWDYARLTYNRYGIFEPR